MRSQTARIRIVLKTSQIQLYPRVLRERKPGTFTFSAKVDSKGRVTVPSSIRKRLGVEQCDSIRLSIETDFISREFDSPDEALKFVKELDGVESFSFEDGFLEVVVNEG